MTPDPTPAWLLRGLQDLRIAFEAVTEQVARSTGLNPRDLGVLDILHAEGPATPTRLSTRTGIHPATLTAALARLERGGHIVRQPDPDDRRSARIAITETTVAMVGQRYRGIDAELHRWFEDMSAADRALIGDFLYAAAATLGRGLAHAASLDEIRDHQRHLRR